MVDKKANPVLYSFFEIVNESIRKPNKSWTDQGKEFYYTKMVRWKWYFNLFNDQRKEFYYVKMVRWKLYFNLFNC